MSWPWKLWKKAIIIYYFWTPCFNLNVLDYLIDARFLILIKFMTFLYVRMRKIINFDIYENFVFLYKIFGHPVGLEYLWPTRFIGLVQCKSSSFFFGKMGINWVFLCKKWYKYGKQGVQHSEKLKNDPKNIPIT